MAARLLAQFTKRHSPSTIVQADLEIRADAGLVTILFGPSASGKTTILRALAGLLRPDEGLIAFGGRTWFEARSGTWVPPQDRHVGLLVQDYALFPHLTVEGNIAYGLRGDRRARQARVAEIADLLGVRDVLPRHPGELSGGQRQRTALGRALAPHPHLLLLDEPLSALDAPLREPLRRELRALLRRLEIPTLLVTHDRNEALALGDQIAVVVAGRVAQLGPVEHVFSRPADPAVAQAVGVETVVPATILDEADGLVRVAVGAVEIAACPPTAGLRGSVLACIRAEEVALARKPPAGSARNHLPGRIVEMSPEGPLVRVFVDCGFLLAALVTRPSCDELGLRVGEAVHAVFKATAVHLIPREPAGS